MVATKHDDFAGLLLKFKYDTSLGYIRFDPKKICNRMSVKLIIFVKLVVDNILKIDKNRNDACG